MKKVLILGAGLVVRPIVKHLLNKGIQVTVATRTKSKAEEMIAGHPNGIAVAWTVEDEETLSRMVAEHDLSVSLLPYLHHLLVAKYCLLHKKNMVTTSYVKPEMQALDAQAKEAGIIILNELGLDPGIDHMSAMRIIDHVHDKGGKIEEFYSICGALPAPEAATNPFKYKFSWSPKGVVLASRNSALYLKNGKQVFIEPVNLFKDRFSYNFPGIGDLDVYPNRDSISYMDIYGITETKTMYRGTFRYKGWCETLDAMKSLNMLDDTIGDYQGMTYAEFLAERGNVTTNDLKKKIAIRLGVDEDSVAIRSFEFLGLFSDEVLNYRSTSPFDITSDRMIKKMVLADNERDMVILQHVFLALYPDGKKEVIKSSMLDFGTPSTNTSIARTVALPAAIAVRMILENKIQTTGVHRPVLPQIYNPVLDELKTLGIEMIEKYGLPENEMICPPAPLKGG